MQPIVVVGSGGMAREAAAWLEDVDADGRLVGFLDEDPQRHGDRLAGLPVLGGLDWLEANPAAEVVLGMGSPAARTRLLERLGALGRQPRTIVHSSAVVGPRVSVGPGAIVCPAAVLTCDIAVGDGVIVNFGALVGHDGRLGSAAFIGPGAQLAGGVEVGARAWVGIGASVIQGVTIGEDAIVGAGAVVIDDVPAATTVVGVPARPVPGRQGGA